MTDIARGVRAFTIGTAISRIMGLIREAVFASLFGAGRSTDAFNAAFRIPNLLRDLFAENALSSAFVPVLTAEKSRSKEAENLFASNILNTLLIVVGVITAAGIFLSPFLARAIAFGFGSIPGKVELTGRLTAVIFPFLLFIALAAWAMSFLNTEGEFFVPSVAPSFFNLFSILTPIALFAYLTGRGIDPIYGMALGVVVGGLLQFLIQVPRLFRKGFHYRLYLSFRNPEFRKMMLLFVPVAIGLSGSRINVFVNTVLISLLEERSMTWLNYAFRIMHLPLGLFGIAVGTVALPTLSRFKAEGNLAEIRKTLFDSLKMVLFLTIPASAIIAFLAHPVTRIVYERGKFTPFDTSQTAGALILYIIGVPFISALRNLAAVFYAFRDARTPMYASFASIGINIALNLALMRPVGFLAFPLSATISAVVNILVLFYLLPRKIGPFEVRPLGKYVLILSSGALIGGAAGWGLSQFLARGLGVSLLSQLAGVALSGAAAFTVFYGICLLLGVSEVRSYIKRLSRG
ncbi:MAG: murein biosynthesis integral membrane protein MurJ [Candidatus Aminicenantales bacterium]